MFLTLKGLVSIMHKISMERVKPKTSLHFVWPILPKLLLSFFFKLFFFCLLLFLSFCMYLSRVVVFQVAFFRFFSLISSSNLFLGLPTDLFVLILLSRPGFHSVILRVQRSCDNDNDTFGEGRHTKLNLALRTRMERSWPQQKESVC